YEEWIETKGGGDFRTMTIKGQGTGGFNAREGGFVYDHGETGGEGSCTYWWTSTLNESDFTVFDIGYCSQDLGGGMGNYSASYGFSVRGIKK
ncbi:MAG: hypothetical protein ACKOSR_06145, partial [Flavobacteriales bacterium]